MIVTKDTKIYEVLEEDETTAPIFIEFGMHCLGCPGARGESVERAARAHGNDPQALIDALNKHLGN